MLITAITADPSIQPREVLSPSKLKQFTQILEDGGEIAPVTVFFDGEVHWLADGFHRHYAYLRAGRTEIPTEVRQGTIRDAIIFGIQINASHGLGLSLSERKQAACRLLLDPEWCKWNDSEIARICRLDRKTFTKVKRKITQTTESPYQGNDSQIYVDSEPELLRNVSWGNPQDRFDSDSLESLTHTDTIPQTSSQNPELLRNVSWGNPQDRFDSDSLESNKNLPDSDSDIGTVMVWRKGKSFPMKSGNIGSKSKLKKLINDPASNVIDITHLTQTVHEALPPSSNNSPGAFTIHSVQFDEPLIADVYFEFNFKVLTSGPSFAMPLIFEMMAGYPLYARHVLNEALKISSKTNGSS